MKIIVVTGLPGSGKSEVCRILASVMPLIETGRAIKDEVRRRGMELTIETSEMMARRLREELGPEAPVMLVRERIEELSKKDVIAVDGLRNIEEADYLRQFGEIIILVVEAPMETRLRRLLKRGDERDPADRKQFDERERKETERGLADLMRTGRYPRRVIKNTGTLKELKGGIERALSGIMVK